MRPTVRLLRGCGRRLRYRQCRRHCHLGSLSLAGPGAWCWLSILNPSGNAGNVTLRSGLVVVGRATCALQNASFYRSAPTSGQATSAADLSALTPAFTGAPSIHIQVDYTAQAPIIGAFDMRHLEYDYDLATNPSAGRRLGRWGTGPEPVIPDPVVPASAITEALAGLTSTSNTATIRTALLNLRGAAESTVTHEQAQA